MKQFTCEPGTEVAGATVLSLVQNINSDDIAPVLEQYGFSTIAPKQWYSLNAFLGLLSEMINHPNVMYNQVAIGISIAEVAIMPPHLQSASFEEMVEAWDEHYQANFRNGYVGHKQTIRVGNNHYKVIFNQTIMPDNIEYGVLYGFAKRFLPSGSHFTVWFDESVPQMDQGGEQTVLHVKWEVCIMTPGNETTS
jgi:hypothetical protein